MTLYHYTCEHSIRQIADAGWMLRPMPQPLLDASLVWLTWNPYATRDALALSSAMLTCDRMQYRLSIPKPVDVQMWNDARPMFDREIVTMLERVRGGDPTTWMISAAPQNVEPLASF